MNTGSDFIRKRIRVQGSVQGVGFRYLTRQAASYLGLTGWVRNEYDGSVLMELQGESHAVDQLLPAVQNGRWIHISDIQEEKIPLQDTERSFRVLF
ncbi:MAG: acylphosphatase [Lachnospiraceae bacterium]|nr:acylphosphatase [Lachnospiraceae bacterium]